MQNLAAEGCRWKDQSPQWPRPGGGHRPGIREQTSSSKRLSSWLSLLTIGLNFQEVKGLFLTKNCTWLVLTRPIRNGQLCGCVSGSEYPPKVGDANRNLRFRGGRVHL